MSQSDDFLSGFLSFRKMLTPRIIQVLFYLSAGALALAGGLGVLKGLAGVFLSGQEIRRGAFAEMLSGAVVLVLGPLTVRIWCELLILFFRMHDALVEIARNTKPRA